MAFLVHITFTGLFIQTMANWVNINSAFNDQLITIIVISIFGIETMNCSLNKWSFGKRTVYQNRL